MNGYAALTFKPIEVCKASYRELLVKLDINRHVKCLNLKNDNELKLMDSHAHSKLQLQYF